MTMDKKAIIEETEKYYLPVFGRYPMVMELGQGCRVWDNEGNEYVDCLLYTSGYAQAIAVNSGCANACTGEQGLADAKKMQSHTAELLGIAPEAVFVCSTGVIGQFLQMCIRDRELSFCDFWTDIRKRKLP